MYKKENNNVKEPYKLIEGNIADSSVFLKDVIISENCIVGNNAVFKGNVVVLGRVGDNAVFEKNVEKQGIIGQNPIYKMNYFAVGGNMGDPSVVDAIDSIKALLFSAPQAQAACPAQVAHAAHAPEEQKDEGKGLAVANPDRVQGKPKLAVDKPGFSIRLNS